MLGIHDFPMFVAASVMLNLTPGPDTMYILGRSIAQGRRSGVASVLGISTGILVHTLTAALGLSAILASSATAFATVKFAGAAYLVFLGAKMLLKRSALETQAVESSNLGYWRTYRQGVITNVLNPKVALFFLALLPQFVDQRATKPALALITLGLTFVVTGTIWCLTLAWFAGLISERFKGGGRLASTINRIVGGVFIGLGVKLALTERP